jgi:hypothetical protein
MWLSQEEQRTLVTLAMEYPNLKELREADPPEARLFLSYAHDKSENMPTLWLLRTCVQNQAESIVSKVG